MGIHDWKRFEGSDVMLDLNSRSAALSISLHASDFVDRKMDMKMKMKIGGGANFRVFQILVFFKFLEKGGSQLS